MMVPVSVACGASVAVSVRDEPQWWCDCPDRSGPHIHFPNWGGQGASVVQTALVDLKTGREIPGTRQPA